MGGSSDDGSSAVASEAVLPSSVLGMHNRAPPQPQPQLPQAQAQAQPQAQVPPRDPSVPQPPTLHPSGLPSSLLGFHHRMSASPAAASSTAAALAPRPAAEAGGGAPVGEGNNPNPHVLVSQEPARGGGAGGVGGDDASLASPKWSERGPPPGFPQIVDTTDNDDGLLCEFRNHLVSGITELSGHYCNTSSDSEYQYGQEAFQRALERREKEREALLAEEARTRKVRMQNAMSQLLAILPATEDTRSETVLTRACEYIRQLTESVSSAHVDNVKLKQRIEQLTSPPQQQQQQQQQHHSSSSSSTRRKSDAAHRRSHAAAAPLAPPPARGSLKRDRERRRRELLEQRRAVMSGNPFGALRSALLAGAAEAAPACLMLAALCAFAVSPRRLAISGARAVAWVARSAGGWLALETVSDTALATVPVPAVLAPAHASNVAAVATAVLSVYLLRKARPLGELLLAALNAAAAAATAAAAPDRQQPLDGSSPRRGAGTSQQQQQQQQRSAAARPPHGRAASSAAASAPPSQPQPPAAARQTQAKCSTSSPSPGSATPASSAAGRSSSRAAAQQQQQAAAATAASAGGSSLNPHRLSNASSLREPSLSAGERPYHGVHAPTVSPPLKAKARSKVMAYLHSEGIEPRGRIVQDGVNGVHVASLNAGNGAAQLREKESRGSRGSSSQSGGSAVAGGGGGGGGGGHAKFRRRTASSFADSMGQFGGGAGAGVGLGGVGGASGGESPRSRRAASSASQQMRHARVAYTFDTDSSS